MLSCHLPWQHSAATRTQATFRLRTSPADKWPWALMGPAGSPGEQRLFPATRLHVYMLGGCNYLQASQSPCNSASGWILYQVVGGSYLHTSSSRKQLSACCRCRTGFAMMIARSSILSAAAHQRRTLIVQLTPQPQHLPRSCRGSLVTNPAACYTRRSLPGT
jgi:hypothetical protein